jgi:putative ABC transport system permease protein
MLRAVGMSQQQSRSMILLEALFQGVSGSLVAVVLGAFVSYLWVTHSLTRILGWMVHFAFPEQSVLVTLMAGVVISIVAGIYPARRAAHLSIVEALEYE